jgi:hypothetical protein
MSRAVKSLVETRLNRNAISRRDLQDSKHELTKRDNPRDNPGQTSISSPEGQTLRQLRDNPGLDNPRIIRDRPLFLLPTDRHFDNWANRLETRPMQGQKKDISRRDAKTQRKEEAGIMTYIEAPTRKLARSIRST